MSLSVIPKHKFTRSSLELLGRRQPTEDELVRMQPGVVVVELQYEGKKFMLAMNFDAYAGCRPGSKPGRSSASVPGVRRHGFSFGRQPRGWAVPLVQHRLWCGRWNVPPMAATTFLAFAGPCQPAAGDRCSGAGPLDPCGSHGHILGEPAVSDCGLGGPGCRRSSPVRCTLSPKLLARPLAQRRWRCSAFCC